MNADLQFPQWQEPLLHALMETNHKSIKRKTEIAKQAILERLSDLHIPEAEKFALHDALSTLRVSEERTC